MLLAEQTRWQLTVGNGFFEQTFWPHFQNKWRYSTSVHGKSSYHLHVILRIILSLGCMRYWAVYQVDDWPWYRCRVRYQYIHQTTAEWLFKTYPSSLCFVNERRRLYVIVAINFIVQFLSASLYFSKRGAYWDRLCRDVVGWLSRACTVAKRCILGL